MSAESISITSYYNNDGKIILPKGIIENPRYSYEPKRYIYNVPDEVLTRPDCTNEFIKATSPRGDYYEYYKPEGLTLESNVIVAKPDNFPLQRIVGPIDFVQDYIDGYKIVDNLFPDSDFHQFDIIASIAVDNIKLVRLNRDTKYWDLKLLESLNINKTIVATRYRFPDENKPSAGIYSDVKWPCYFDYYYVGRPRYPRWIKCVCGIIHEFTHRALDMGEDKVEAHLQEVIAIENDIIMKAVFWVQNEFGNEADYWLGKSSDILVDYLSQHKIGLPSHFQKVKELTE